MVGESGRVWEAQTPPKGLSPMQSSPDILTNPNISPYLFIHTGKVFHMATPPDIMSVCG